MSSEIVIQAAELCKCYHVYDKPHDRLLQMLFRGRKRFYKEYWALPPISFSVNKGETIGIIGRNGAGKSTLLQLVCNTLTPTSGMLDTKGRIAALLELGSGFNPEFTGAENVYLNASILGLTRTEIDQNYGKILEFADIGEYINQPVKTYSSGMIVRLAFAVIAHVSADILVIDEALAVGDVFFQQKCLRFLRNFKEAGGTIVFVSHDTGAVKALCEKAILLSDKLPENYLVGDTEKVCKIYLEELYVRKQEELSPVVETCRSERATPFSNTNRTISGTVRTDNPLSVSNFRADSESMGIGGAAIVDAWFSDANGCLLRNFHGGERVSLNIKAQIDHDIQHPAFGFMLKDRLGQFVVAEGSDNAYRDSELFFVAGQVVTCEFSFIMPILIQGQYSMNVALASGLGDDHVQLHWLYDALLIESMGSRLVHGISGLHDLNIFMHISDTDTQNADKSRPPSIPSGE